MRRYTDPAGRAWDIVIGRESFGSLFALFTPGAGNAEDVRQTQLRAESHAEAEAELDAMGEDTLHALFDRSEPKGLG